MKKEIISKIRIMNESTSFLSLFSPRNKTFMKACENSKELCILVFSNTHSCPICIIYNDNYILATDDIIFDNVSMHAWPSNLILTTLADNGLITCAKCSYKLAENLGRRNWTERLKSNSVNSTSIQKFGLMLLLCYWITKFVCVQTILCTSTLTFLTFFVRFYQRV